MIKLKSLILEINNIEYGSEWYFGGADEHRPPSPDTVERVVKAIHDELKRGGIGNPNALIKVSLTTEDGNRWWVSTVAKWSKISSDNRLGLFYYDESGEDDGWYMSNGGEKLNDAQLQYCIKNWRKLSIGR